MRTLAMLLTTLTAPPALADTLVFQDVSGGYAGTVDTYLSENEPTTSHGTLIRVEWDNDDPSGTGRRNIALLRFDGMFGAGPGQIPPGAQITSAALRYVVNDSGDSGRLHESLVDWDELVTWDTFGGEPGVQTDERSAQVTTLPGTSGAQNVNVTESLTRWAADPSTHHGWVVLPTGSGGVQFRSREYTVNPANRPKLTVVINEGPPVVSLVRQPYLQRGTPTSVVICWRTDLSCDTRVRYGTSPGVLDQSVVDAASVKDHEIEITSLSPGTTYYYDVGTTTAALAGGTPSYFFATSPQPGTSVAFNAWVVGDSGTGGSAQAAVRDAMLANTASDPPEFWLTVGDNAYDDGTDAEYTTKFFAPYSAIMRSTMLWPAPGNHDMHSADSAAQTGPYFDAFAPPTAGQAGGVASGTEAYYSYDFANAHVISLDSAESDLSPGSPMLTWLAADLAATQADWLVAHWHHAPYTKGTHDSDEPGDSDGIMIAMRENVLPLLEAGGVDLVLCGHSHTYERSFLVDGAYDTPTTAAGHIVDGGDGRPAGGGAYVKPPGLTPHAGAVYVVAGHGGQSIGAQGVHPLMYFTEVAYGSCILSIHGCTLSLRNVRSDGVVSDAFTIQKVVPGDSNRDGVVDNIDLQRVLDAWASVSGDPDYDAGVDFNGDLAIDNADLRVILESWATTCPP
jgi:hypothetical protein